MTYDDFPKTVKNTILVGGDTSITVSRYEWDKYRLTYRGNITFEIPWRFEQFIIKNYFKKGKYELSNDCGVILTRDGNFKIYTNDYEKKKLEKLINESEK